MRRRSSIAAKFFLTYFVITGVALAFAGTAGYVQFRRYAIDEVDQRLLGQARFAAVIFRPLLETPAPDRNRIAREGDRIGKDLDVRLTVILPDGTVVADSRVGAAGIGGMENHAGHSEVAGALAGGTGISMRRSITTGDEQRYLAIPIRSRDRTVGVARASVPVPQLGRGLRRIAAITWGTGVAAFLLMLAGTALRARRIAGPLGEMGEAARALASGDFKKRVRVGTGDELEEMGAALNHMADRLERTISQLDAGKARLETLLKSLSEGVIVIAADRTVRMMNPEAARILETAGTAGEGRPYIEIIRNPEMLAFIDAWRGGAGAPSRDVQVPARHGHRAIRMAGTVVLYAAEPEADLLLTLTDVTEEKRIERMKSDFASNASHELRTPLTSIRGYLEAVEDAVKEGSPVDPSFVAIAQANALRMERLIDDLLELSRAESGQLPPAPEEIPLPVFLDRVASIHRPDASRRGKSLEVGGEEIRIRVDVRRMALALSNLIDNALKHGIERGSVSVKGYAAEGALLLEVADDGPGISPEHLPRIFERFYRVDKGRSRDLGGTGLGLSIVRHVVESHGGTIRVESRPGAGTRFTIRLPEALPVPTKTGGAG